MITWCWCEWNTFIPINDFWKETEAVKKYQTGCSKAESWHGFSCWTRLAGGKDRTGAGAEVMRVSCSTWQPKARCAQWVVCSPSASHTPSEEIPHTSNCASGSRDSEPSTGTEFFTDNSVLTLRLFNTRKTRKGYRSELSFVFAHWWMDVF